MMAPTTLFLFFSMLALRATWQPTKTACRPSLCPKRRLHTTIPKLQGPRPDGVLAKIRFRADGKPRSKWMGVVVGTLLFTNAQTLLAMYDVIEESENTLGLLASVISMQRLDVEYDSVNLDDPIATYAYFKRLYQSFCRLPEDIFSRLFTPFDGFMHSPEPEYAEIQGHVYEIMRQAVEQVHKSFHDLNQDTIAQTSNSVLLIMTESMEQLLEHLQELDDDEDNPREDFLMIKAHTKKQKDSALKDYEILG